jgi:uncharacterized protein YheU (UPF0270 family)
MSGSTKSTSTADQRAMLVIPHRELSTSALQGLIEEFVSRDGTDSGYTRGSLAESVDMVRRQLDTGRAFIVFDRRSQTWNIVPADQVPSSNVEF